MRSWASFFLIAIFFLTTIAWASDPEMDAIQREIQDVQAEIVKVNQESQGKPNTGKMLKLIQKLQELEARKAELALKKDPGSVTFQERDRIHNGYIFNGLRQMQEGFPERALRELQKAWDLSDHPLDRAEVASYLLDIYLRHLHHPSRVIENARVVLEAGKYPIKQDIDRFEADLKASGEDAPDLLTIARKIVVEDPLASEVYLGAFLHFKVALSATARDKANRLHTLLRKHVYLRSYGNIYAYYAVADAYEAMGKGFERESYLEEAKRNWEHLISEYEKIKNRSVDHILEEVKRLSAQPLTRDKVEAERLELLRRQFTGEYGLAMRQISMGRYLREKGKEEDARRSLALARSVLDSSRRILPHLSKEAQPSLSLDTGESFLAEEEGDLPRAITWARQYLKDWETYMANTKTTRVTYAEIYANRRLGTLYLRSGQIQEALAQMLKVESLYKRAEEEAQTEGYNIIFLYDKWEAYRDIGGCYLRLAEGKKDQAALDRAESYLRQGVALVDQTYRELHIDPLKTSFLSDKLPLYQDYVTLLMERGKEEEAYRYVEHSKSRALIDMLGNMKIRPRHGMDPTFTEKLEEFKRKLKDLRQELESPQGDSSRSRSAREEFRAVRTALSDFLQQVELRAPEDALEVLKQAPTFTAADLRKLTRNPAWSGTVFLEFFLGTRGSYGFVSRDGTFRTFRVPAGDKEIRKLVAGLRDKIKGKSPDWKEDAARLYGLLIKPAEKEMAGASRLAVIPNGPLHYLPFSVLPDEAGKLLIEKIPLFTLPSATVARFVQSGGEKKSDEMLLLANPDGSLPFAEAEATAINQATKLRPRILLKNQAAEGTVKRLTGSAGYVHFATHGILDGGQPLYSALILAPDKKEDGRLEMHEIFNELDLKHTRLVTLSACNTAVGPETGGDEIAGLSRAFMYAGAPSVLASLWAVDDYSTSRLMTEFYRNLSGSDKAQALQKAQLAVYSEEKVSHPFYWAAFELIGSFK